MPIIWLRRRWPARPGGVLVERVLAQSAHRDGCDLVEVTFPEGAA